MNPINKIYFFKRNEFKFLIIPIFFLFVINFLSALPDEADNQVNFDYPEDVNYSLINVNDSDFLDGIDSTAFPQLNVDNTGDLTIDDIFGDNITASSNISGKDISSILDIFVGRDLFVANDSTVYGDIICENDIYAESGNVYAANVTAGLFFGDGSGLTGVSANHSNTTSWWADVSGFITNYLFKNAENLDFNETKLNETVLDLTKSTTYNATSISTTAGTNTGGNLNSVLSLNDGNTYNVSEGVGAPPVLVVNINFTGVETLTQALFNEQYTGLNSHVVAFQMWNYITSGWDTFHSITDQSYLTYTAVPIPQPDNYISGGIVQARFYHLSSGNANHRFYLDYIVLLNGVTGITSNEHDALSGRSNILTNHPNIVNIFYNKTEVNEFTTNNYVKPASDNNKLLFYFTFNNNTLDYSDNYNLTQNGTPTQTNSGRLGKAYYFDGNNDWFDVNFYPNNSSATLNYWVNFNVISAVQTGVNDGSNHRFYLGINDIDDMYIGVGSSLSTAIDLNLIENFVVNRWYMLTLTTNGTTAKVYMNGRFIESLDYTFSGVSSLPFAIGGVRTASTIAGDINGTIDEVMIWNRTLTDLEIFNLYYNMGGNFNNFTELNSMTDVIADDEIISGGNIRCGNVIYLGSQGNSGTATYNGNLISFKGLGTSDDNYYYARNIVMPNWGITSSSSNNNYIGAEQDELFNILHRGWTYSIEGFAPTSSQVDSVFSHSPGVYISSLVAFNLTIQNNTLQEIPIRSSDAYWLMISFRTSTRRPNNITVYVKNQSGNWEFTYNTVPNSSNTLVNYMDYITPPGLGVFGIRIEFGSPIDSEISLDDIYLLHSTAPVLEFLTSDNALLYGNLTIYNETGSANIKLNKDGTAYFDQNITARGFNTMTEVYDRTRGSALSWIRDSTALVDARGNILHKVFYGYENKTLEDTTRPIKQNVCGEVVTGYKTLQNCINITEEEEVTDEQGRTSIIITTRMECDEPVEIPIEEYLCWEEVIGYHPIQVETVNLVKEIAMIEQSLSDIKECTKTSRSWEEYQICVSKN